jgi:hypothetical protein
MQFLIARDALSCNHPHDHPFDQFVAMRLYALIGAKSGGAK